MAEKEILALSNPNLQPGDDLVFMLIGDKKVYWQKIIKHMLDTYSGVTWSWNWYNDGKQWLFKLVRKNKTVFWAAILTTGQFRITFYFGDKAEPAILSADLPKSIKENFLIGPHYGKIRAVSLLVNTPEDADTVLKVADLKIKMK
jgi:ABC-type uncharacterized transport system YnjBCD substrate-binding protein